MSQERPNIIFIMSDDHSANAIGCYGSKVNETPNIDKIARQGMIFNHCYCTNSLCAPSRAVILSGMHSHKNGVKTLDDKMPRENMHLPLLMQKNGYETSIVGKWHLCDEPPEAHTGDNVGVPNGFDYSDILIDQGTYFDPVMVKNGEIYQEKGYVTNIITRKTIERLESRDTSKPFCLFCHHKAPHDPWTYDEAHSQFYLADRKIPETFYEDYSTHSGGLEMCTQKIGKNHTLYEEETKDLQGNARKEMQYQIFIKKYCRCIASIDDSVGEVLDYLEKNSLAENTIVIYTSDQGFFLGEHGLYDKRFMYEESIQMPFVMKYPKLILPKAQNNMLVQNIDFAPTLLELAGVEIPSFMDGESFVGSLGEMCAEGGRDAIYYRYFMHLAHFNVPAHLGVRTKQYKLICYYGKALGNTGCIDKDTPEEWELFDLENDPNEANNLYQNAAYDTIKLELKKRLAELMEQYGDVV